MKHDIRSVVQEVGYFIGLSYAERPAGDAAGEVNIGRQDPRARTRSNTCCTVLIIVDRVGNIA